MARNIPTIWLTISKAIMGRCLNLGAIYRKWACCGDNSLNGQLERIETTLNQVEKATENNKFTAILGDINLCSTKWSEKSYPQKTLADKWRAGMAKSGVELLELGTTYFSTGNFAKSALDHIYSNLPQKFVEWKVLDDSSTDHLPIMAKIKRKHIQKEKIITKRDKTDSRR